jgi:hypothetical protein
MGFAYVYAVLVDGIVRYIGKGSGRRLRSHMKIVRSMARRRAAGETIVAGSPFYEDLCKAYLWGSGIEAVILKDCLLHEQAFRHEIAERGKYPASQLWNSGRCWDRPEYRAKQRARWADPEMRAFHRSQVAASITAAEKAERARRMKLAWAKDGAGGNLRRAQEARRAREFEASLAGQLLAVIRATPDGLRFSEIKRFHPHLRPTSTLRKLASRGLIVKGPLRESPWVATNIIETGRA